MAWFGNNVGNQSVKINPAVCEVMPPPKKKTIKSDKKSFTKR